MFRFEDPIYLYLLLLLPVWVVIYLFMLFREKKKLKLFGDLNLLKILAPDVSPFRKHIKFVCLMLALGLLICMMARPQFGLKIDTNKRNGIEAIIALDVSNSMLAEDVSPNRLERSKMLISNLVDKMTDDKVGMIVFAGEAFTQLPITSDYVSAKMFLDAISPNMIASQGTDIGGAINLAMKSFTQTEGVGRAIILITDGENHEGGAEEAAAEAAKKGIHVFIIGVGKPDGGPIPIGNGEYLRDNSGNVVVTRLDENMCRLVAKAGNGTFIRLDNTSLAQRSLSNELDKLTKKELNSTVYSEYDEQFQAVAILVLLILIIEICILERKNPFFKKIKLFRKS